MIAALIREEAHRSACGPLSGGGGPRRTRSSRPTVSEIIEWTVGNVQLDDNESSFLAKV